MEYENIHQIAIVYGKKDLVEYFVEQFNMDRLDKIKEIMKETGSGSIIPILLML